MDRAAGRYSKCLLGADARNAKKENASKLAKRQARCDAHFERDTTRAIEKYGPDNCTSAHLVSAMADRTVSCAEGVAKEAGGTAAASLMYVQNADGGTLTESTLTLTGVNSQTVWFTERPYRDAGRMTTAEFVALFSEEGANSFAADPPNADSTCESGGEDVNYVVELTELGLDEATDILTYTVAVVSPTTGEKGFAIVTCDADAHLFMRGRISPSSPNWPSDSHCPNRSAVLQQAAAEVDWHSCNLTGARCSADTVWPDGTKGHGTPCPSPQLPAHPLYLT